MGIPLPRCSCALCGGCGGVLGGQSVQYAAAVFGQYGFFKEGLESLVARDREYEKEGRVDMKVKIAHRIFSLCCVAVFVR